MQRSPYGRNHFCLILGSFLWRHRRPSVDMKRVLAFGTFDPLHDGHRDYFRQARALGDELIVIVAHDKTILTAKQRVSRQSRQARLEVVAAEAYVDEALLGDIEPDRYELLSRLQFNVLALGYDQEPSDSIVRAILDRLGKKDVHIVRLLPYQPDRFKSSLVRPTS